MRRISGVQRMRRISGVQRMRRISGFQRMRRISGFQRMRRMSGFQRMRRMSGFQRMRRMSGFQRMRHIFGFCLDEPDNENVLSHLDISNKSASADNLVFPSMQPYLLQHFTPPHMQHERYSMLVIDDLDLHRSRFLEEDDTTQDRKGKGVASQPVLIRRVTNCDQHDLFAVSLESGFSFGSC
jgi:hypothetical protein